MIRIAKRDDVHVLLHHILTDPEMFERVIVCSPFLDDEGCGLLAKLAQALHGAQCGFKVLTRSQEAEGLIQHLPRRPANRSATVIAIPDLHAKAYLAVARRATRTKAIVTSANLTRAGQHQNFELGVLAIPTSDGGRKIVSELRGRLERLLDVPRQPRSINTPRRLI